MELRKDPITRSWVVVGHPERQTERAGPCPLCPENREQANVLLELPQQGQWQVRAYPHCGCAQQTEPARARCVRKIESRPTSCSNCLSRDSGKSARIRTSDRSTILRATRGAAPTDFSIAWPRSVRTKLL